MEQLGPAIQFVTKHRFWFICGLGTLMALGAWYWANATLTSQRITNQMSIQQQITDIDRIKKTTADLTPTIGTGAPPADAGIVAHPNRATQEGMQQEIKAAMAAMIEAWRARRSAQESILRWPEEVLGSKEFVTKFSEYDPPEKFSRIPDTGFSSLLILYQQRIPQRMAELCDIVNTKWNHKSVTASSTAGGAGSTTSDPSNPIRMAGSADIDRRTYTVVWNDQNQKLWFDKLTLFKGRDGNLKESPTPYQVLALQQDLWLLEAMFNIIKEINGDAAARDFAAIKTIYYVVFGREARITGQPELTKPNPKLVGHSSRPEDSSVGPDFDRDPMAGASSGPFTAGGETGTAEVKFDPKLTELHELAPFHGRYVNELLQPIPIKTIYDVLNATDLPADNLELVVAKRVPVRIAVRMDERRIADFIAACRNSPFAFEIELVRFNCDVSGKGIELGGGTGQTGAVGGRDGSQLAVGGSGGGAGAGSATADDGSGSSQGAGAGAQRDSTLLPVEVRTDYDVNVEFYGIVKIYNRVDEQRVLGQIQDAATVTQSPGQTRSGGQLAVDSR